MASNPAETNIDHIINLCIILTLGYAFSGNFFWIQLEKTHNIRMTLFLYTIWTALSLGVSYVHIRLTNFGLSELKRVEKNLKNLGRIFTFGAYVVAGFSIWIQMRATHEIWITLVLYGVWTALSLGVSYVHIKLSTTGRGQRNHASRMSPPALLALYNKKWLFLPPHSQKYLFPNPHLSPSGFYTPDLNLSHEEQCRFIVLETQNFFLRGYEIEFALEGERIVIAEGNDVGRVRALEKFLRRKELPRWHPDWFCRRTGEEGVRDERLGQVPGIVAIRTGLQDLVSICEEWLTGE